MRGGYPLALPERLPTKRQRHPILAPDLSAARRPYSIAEPEALTLTSKGSARAMALALSSSNFPLLPSPFMCII